MGAETQPLVGYYRVLAPAPGLRHHRPLIVQEDLLGHPARGEESLAQPRHERLPGLIGSNHRLAPAGEAEQVDQQDHGACAREKGDLDLAEVGLGLEAGQGFEAYGGHSGQLLPSRAYVVLDDGVAALVSERLETLVYDGGSHLGPHFQPAVDDHFEGIELRASPSPPCPRRLFLLAELLGGPPVDSQQFSNFHIAHSLSAQSLCVHPDSLPVHRIPPFFSKEGFS